MKSEFQPILLFVSMILVPKAWAAATLTVNPTIDAFVSSLTPTSNYGGAGALEISAPGSAKGEFQSLMQFDFSTFKNQFDTAYGVAGWLVDSIFLQLTAANPNNPIFNTTVAGNLAIRWFSNDGWTEGNGTPSAATTTGGVTFNSLSILFGMGTESVATYAFGGGTSGTNKIGISPSAGLLADITNGTTASLDLYAGDTTLSALFNSKNNGTVGSRPSLIVTASPIPEPSAGILALTVLFASVIRLRR